MLRRIGLSLVAVGGLLTLGAANPRDEADVARMLAGKTPGKPRLCLNQLDAQSSSVHDGTVLFRVSSRLVYRNDMDKCSLLRADDILVTHSYGSGELCRGDIVQVIDRTSRIGKGACTYGEFVPYQAPKAR